MPPGDFAVSESLSDRSESFESSCSWRRSTLVLLLSVGVACSQGDVQAPGPPSSPSRVVVPAFPGAEGHGALALSECRSLPLEVRAVANLSDRGTGSLRNAIEGSRSDRFSIVVFRTGGTITLSSLIRLDKPCLYIAGQTAPGGGIQVRAPNDPAHQVPLLVASRDGSARDLVIRYLRLRAGRGEAGMSDNVSILSGSNIVLDHLSTAFGNDESISPFTKSLSDGGQKIEKLTIQWSLITTSLYPHAAGTLLGGDWGAADVEGVTLHHNGYIHNSGRNPEVKRGYRVQVINNVVYNWNTRVGQTWGDATVDFIGNYWKRGPLTGGGHLYRARVQGDEWTEHPKLYVSGNVASPDARNIATDQRNFIVLFDGEADEAGVKKELGPLPDSTFLESPSSRPDEAVSVETATDGYDSVLEGAGASRALNCRGEWVDRRDRLDALLVSQVRDGSGPVDSEAANHQRGYGGFPVLAPGSPCPDRDADGMPDEYESIHGLNPGDLSDAYGDADRDGYLNLEEYLSGTSPR